jgi:hypothetical protein
MREVDLKASRVRATRGDDARVLGALRESSESPAALATPTPGFPTRAVGSASAGLCQGECDIRTAVTPKARKGSESARTGVRRDSKRAARQDASVNRALWTQAAVANSARTTSGAEDERPNRSTTKLSGNQTSHSIAPIANNREHPASIFRRRETPSLIGTATNGAKRLAPANQMNSSGILWAWAALAENRTSAKGART